MAADSGAPERADGATPARDDDQQPKKVAEPVSEYLRFLIADWERKGGKLYVLAEQAGLAKSMPSQIKARTSDASFYSAAKLAAPLGYPDLPSLVQAAYAWWNSVDRTVRPETGAPPPARTFAHASLVAAARELGYSDAEVETAALATAMVRIDAPLPREKASELLARARFFIRDGARSVREVAARDSDDEKTG